MRWTCHDCNGDGWYWVEERKRRVFCACPAGERKRASVKSTRWERSEERKRRKKREDKVPF